ncbi:uncharacterized protein LOC118182228 [Stegodyphus dumicola]|uniref:uncharacterized protein LOC118182228 n=1 Tax=Stegodyphus dumicola TaxID=202533 RepID=UPI0015B343DB|nr:uncharacterized protein LOC118182228 [Stegodyphus dumicola]
MQYGLANEAKALAQYEHDKQLYVHRCGLFIDPANPFLCTSPDGLIGDIGLVEVKCPYSARDSTNLKEFFKQNKQQGLKWNANGSFYLPDTHKYYFQIQGQLNITNRSWCDLFYWCQGDTLTVRIEKNEKFWKNILPKLNSFFFDCVLPEILDPRATRNMTLREPYYIIEKVNSKKGLKSRKLNTEKTETKLKHKKTKNRRVVSTDASESQTNTSQSKRIRKPKIIFDL